MSAHRPNVKPPAAGGRRNRSNQHPSGMPHLRVVCKGGGSYWFAVGTLLTNRSVNVTIFGMPLKGHRTKAGERTRTAIVEATLKLLSRAGPDAFSASTLATEAGVSKATLFHHFRAIDEIPLAALQHLWSQALAPRGDNAKSARQYLQELGRQVFVLAHRRSGFLRAHVVFLTKAIFDPRLRKRLAAGALQMHQLMKRTLSEKLPKNLSPSELEAVTRMVEMALDGLMIRLVVMQNSKELGESKRAWTRFVDLLLAGAE